ERLRSLVEAIRGDDPDEQRWARYELEDAVPEPTWEDDAGLDETLTDQIWSEERCVTLDAPA
ncbi:MAG TPA: hypothetical protein VFI44_10320, partial [Ornithinibacter sp.]|nr:hypothetical protein [Ornithinibacter sp.]